MGSARRRALPLKRSSIDSSSLGAKSASRTSHLKAAADPATATDIGVEDVARGIVGDAFPCDAAIDGSAYWLLIRRSSCPAWTRRSPRKRMGSYGRLS